MLFTKKKKERGKKTTTTQLRRSPQFHWTKITEQNEKQENVGNWPSFKKMLFNRVTLIHKLGKFLKLSFILFGETKGESLSRAFTESTLTNKC